MREKDLVMMVADYLRLQYPWVVARFDLAADMKLTMGQAARHKRLHPKRGYPDLFIAQPSGQYHGLYLELKAPGVRLYNTSGQPATPHLREQLAMLRELREKGYAADFAVGFDEAQRLIDAYLVK